MSLRPDRLFPKTEDYQRREEKKRLEQFGNLLTEVFHKAWRSKMFRFCKKVLLIDSVAFGITGTLWLGGQRTADRLGSILLILGAIVAAIGAFIGEGARWGSVDYTYFRARSVGTANHDERTRQEWDYKEHSDYVGGILAVAGGVLLGVGVTLLWFFAP